MQFGPRLRKVFLAVHVASSVGWLGAVAAFLALDVATVSSRDVDLLRACYLAMDLLARWVIVPLAAAALLSGVVQSLGTPWGLFRHYWVVVSLVLTVVATAVLLVQLPVIGHRAEHAADPAATDDEVRGLGNLLLHSIGGAIVLVIILVLNVLKPRGLTPYGWRRQQDAGGTD